MKRLLWLMVCVLVAMSMQAQDLVEKVSVGSETPSKPKEKPADRMFFPHDMFWGYTQFDIAPPHNEIDPNLCRADAGNQGGVNAPCNAFGRYMLSGLVEVRPFGQGPLRRVMLFAEPRFLFGNNIPQTLYTWSIAPIGWERSWGAGVYLGRGFELRVTQHFLFNRLGDRNHYLGTADLGPNGPWGRYNMIGVRKYFGQRRW
jgi:hypothetical protein